MARISSMTLFNFTDNLEYLVNNLESGFYCHNTYEKLPYGKNGYRVSMACFCDIPLSLIKEHFDWYGRYGIGIKKSYARDLGVKPVWYITSENELVRNIVKKSKEQIEYERKHLIPYLKQYMGNQYFDKIKAEKRKKFYDEREWRYLPDSSSTEIFFGEKANRSKPVAKQNGHRMKLDLSQVEYIIIEKEADIEFMLGKLKELAKNNKIKYESLVSKLITSKQIEQDF
jgi:hypothetical protein